MMSGIIDSHSHIQMRSFGDDQDAAIDRARAAGVACVVVCGDDLPTSEAAIELAGRHSGTVIPTVGIHPHEASAATVEILERIETLAEGNSRVAGIGEIGLDFYRNHSPREAQLSALEGQLGIAVRLGLPVVIHSRGAEDELVEILVAHARRTPPDQPPGVLHCFGGSLEQARQFVGAGYLVSLACNITYPNNYEARRIARKLPLDALLVETDSPYLPPHGQRGKRNEPANVVAAVGAIAAERSLAFHDVAEATAHNARRLFRVRTLQEACSA